MANTNHFATIMQGRMKEEPIIPEDKEDILVVLPQIEMVRG